MLFSIAGTIGKTALVEKCHLPANTNQAVAIIRGTLSFFEPKFLRQQLKEAASRISRDNARGGAMNNISLANLKDYLVAVPPLAEQKVIADKLDSLLAQVDNIKTRLDALPTIIKRFKQSVLSAAVSGKLTEDWRGVNLTNVSHKVNLTKLVKFRQGTQVPSLEQVDEPIEGYDKFLRIINFTQKSKDFKFVPRCKSNRFITHHDIVMVRYGATAGFVGSGLEGVLANNLFVIEPNQLLRHDFLFAFLESPVFQNEITSMVKGGAMPAISFKLFEHILILLPSLEEQTEIVRRVEQLFAYADQIEQQVKNAQSRVNNLTQSILAKAFRGELTADWRAANPHLISGENSAQALLAKIKAERDKPKKISKQQAMFNE